VTSVIGLESLLLVVLAWLGFSRKNQRSAFSDFCNTIHLKADVGPRDQNVRFVPIVLQKSKVVALRIFRENKKRETITDSYTLNRVAEVAGEFNVRGSVPSHL
jgi:hypothetical protein